MKKKKMNDKGFSLVELIVVIAIMAILAVTLAPRLMKYVDNARDAHDQQSMNAIFTAAQIAYMQEPAAFQAADTLFTGANDDRLQLRLTNTARTGDATDTLYNSNGITWTIDDTFPVTTPASTNAFTAELQDTLGNFNLQSDLASNETQIIISLVSDRIVVTLDYNGTGFSAAEGDIQVTE